MEDPPNQAGKKTKRIGCSQQHCLKWYHVVCEEATHHDVNADAYICKACQNIHRIVLEFTFKGKFIQLSSTCYF